MPRKKKPMPPQSMADWARSPAEANRVDPLEQGAMRTRLTRIEVKKLGGVSIRPGVREAAPLERRTPPRKPVTISDLAQSTYALARAAAGGVGGVELGLCANR